MNNQLHLADAQYKTDWRHWVEIRTISVQVIKYFLCNLEYIRLQFAFTWTVLRKFSVVKKNAFALRYFKLYLKSLDYLYLYIQISIYLKKRDGLTRWWVWGSVMLKASLWSAGLSGLTLITDKRQKCTCIHWVNLKTYFSSHLEGWNSVFLVELPSGKLSAWRNRLCLQTNTWAYFGATWKL